MIKINRGITLIEIIIVISIIIMISVLVLPNLTRFKKDQSLRNTTEEIVSLLSKARNNTMASLNLNNYGVHFESSQVVLFAGSTYNSADPLNEIIMFDPLVKIPATGGINVGGGSNVVFERMTGNTSNNGTIILQLSADSTRQKIITISKVGLISTN